MTIESTMKEDQSKEPLKHVNINIPESKHLEFKIRATGRGETMQEVVERAIDNYLAFK